MKKNLLFSCAFIVVFVSHCHSSKNQIIKEKSANNSISIHKSIKNDSVLDSIVLNNFFRFHPQLKRYQEPLLNLYHRNNLSFVWIFENKLKPEAINSMDWLKNEPLLLFTDGYWNELDSLIHALNSKEINSDDYDTIATNLDLLLTCYLFSYADRNWFPFQSNILQEINWQNPSTEDGYSSFLDTIHKTNGLINWKVNNNKQRGLLQKYADVYINGIKVYRKGINLNSSKDSISLDSLSELLWLKKNWKYLKYPTASQSKNSLDTELKKLILYFQNNDKTNHHLKIAVGAIHKLDSILEEITVKLLINQERTNWLNGVTKSTFIQVNIPEFKLYFYRNDTLIWSTDVIVGKSSDPYKTSVFDDQVEYVVFNPYWVIPDGILKTEIFPAMVKDRKYLKKNNMEILNYNGKKIQSSSIDWKNVPEKIPFLIRQLPGKKNPLGRIKFLFPNPYEIYIHDTPEKKLFNNYPRDYSHGCIRIKEPEKFADLLLCETNGICVDSIENIINAQKESYVKLKKSIPIYITYFTAWVDTSGNLQLWDDIYGYDRSWKQFFFSGQSTDVKP